MNNQDSPKWLTELQQKSWEPEILLSGIVLYGMFQAPGLLDEFLMYAKVNMYGMSTDFDNMIALMKIAFYWLTFGLILHLISRGIWVGMVGLSFTFPKGINHEKLKLAPKFSEQIEKIPSIQQIVINLEKLCSSLFSISFMLFMSIVGGYLYFFVCILTPVLLYVFVIADGNWSDTEQLAWNTYIFTVVGIGLIALLDFITLGFLKRIKWLSKIYFPLYRIISFLTLSRFYRPVYYAMITNYGRLRIALFLTFFTIISIAGLISSMGSRVAGDAFSFIDMWNPGRGYEVFSGHYDDQNKEQYSLRAQIQSDIISGNTVRLFVVLRSDLEDSIKNYCNYDSLIQTDTPKRQVDFDCLTDFYHVLLDDSLLQDLTWKYHFKSHTNQKGILTYLDITNLTKGMHEIRVKGPEKMYQWDFARITFYREYNALPIKYMMKNEDPDESVDYLKLKPILPK